MFEIYKQIKEAIEQKLYVSHGRNWNNNPAWYQPVRIESDKIIMLWADCGDVNNPDDLSEWTLEEWREQVKEDGAGLYKKVGMWDFAPASDPACELIKTAHRWPDSIARQLYAANERIAELELRLRELEKGE